MLPNLNAMPISGLTGHGSGNANLVVKVYLKDRASGKLTFVADLLPETYTMKGFHPTCLTGDDCDTTICWRSSSTPDLEYAKNIPITKTTDMPVSTPAWDEGLSSTTDRLYKRYLDWKFKTPPYKWCDGDAFPSAFVVKVQRTLENGKVEQFELNEGLGMSMCRSNELLSKDVQSLSNASMICLWNVFLVNPDTERRKVLGEHIGNNKHVEDREWFFYVGTVAEEPWWSPLPFATHSTMQLKLREFGLMARYKREAPAR